jgi:hypothetical protein
MDVGEFMVVNPEITERQYYAIIEDNPVLVRMENISGKPLRNIYSFASNMKGPPLPSWGMGKWVSAIKSDSNALIMASLVWLGGEHRNIKHKQQLKISIDDKNIEAMMNGTESLEQVRLLESVRDDESVINTLNKHRRSSNPWIRELAEMANTPKYYSIFSSD